MKSLLSFMFLFTITLVSAQSNIVSFKVLDGGNKEPLFGAAVVLLGTTNGAITNEDGTASVKNIPNGEHTFSISYMGYEKQTLTISVPNESPSYTIELVSVTEFDEVMVEATRANRTISNLPTRTEVLTEEIDEAASMEPGKIAHLITHSTGIQVQTTAATSNGAVVRIQGLNGRYTQMLKDGFPLYGGFSGSLDILQIPPLDLRQVEYIKGSASTLYGGGAIGGLINLLTKKPSKDETLLHINFSHIGAKDFNAFASRKFGKFGFTNLASMHLHTAYDADNDGYSDNPDVMKFNFNPKLFFYPDAKSTIYFGADITRDQRLGGDMELIDDAAASTTHYYLDKQKSSRYTTQFSADRKFTESSTLTLKNSVSWFSRRIEIREDTLGTMTMFDGTQMNSFSEINYNLNKTQHNLNIGLNVYTDQFTERLTDSVPSRNQSYLTYGLFANHLWDIHEKFALETGLRGDYVTATAAATKSNGDFFALPRISMLYKANRALSIRLGGGMGYRMPTIFNEEAEPFGFKNIQPVDFENVAAERSYGGNIDFKYQSTFGTENILLTFNQMFFYNLIDNPIQLGFDSTGMLAYSNTSGFLNSRGFESQIKLSFWNFTWFFGYTYTDAFIETNGSEARMTLTPQHSIKGDLLFVVENKWRIGWDYEYKSEQLLTNGFQTRSIFTTGVIVERTLKNFVIFLNAENFTDTRQTRYESILSGPNNTPQFTDIWAPLDGFFFNAGLKIKL